MNTTRFVALSLGLFVVVVFVFISHQNNVATCKEVVPNPLLGKTRVYKFGKKGSTTEPRRQRIGPIEWKRLPTRVQNDFLLDGKMAFSDFYCDGDGSVSSYNPNFTKEPLEKSINATKNLIKKLKDGETLSKEDAESVRSGYYPCIVSSVAQALFDVVHVEEKDTLVLDSLSTWNEAMLIAFGARSVVSSNNRDTTDSTSHPKFSWIKQHKLTGRTFDAIFKFDDDFDAFMHTGLGRYGDNLSPDGDIEKMRNIGVFLKEQGYLVISLPLGPDFIEYNAHRIYGPNRLEKMLEGYKVVSSYPCLKDYPTRKDAFKAKLSAKWENQWVFVLQKDNSNHFWSRTGEACTDYSLLLILFSFGAYIFCVTRFVFVKNEPRLPI